WWGPGQREVLEALDAERQNLEAALARCLRSPDEAAAGLAICRDTWFFWHAQRRLAEGRRWLEELLAASPAPTAERAAGLAALGSFLLLHQAAPAAEATLEEAVALGMRLGLREVVVLALGRLAMVSAAQRD